MAIANPLKLRRGLVSAVAGATIAAGEPVFTTDQARLYISDGSTKHVVGLKDNPAASASPGVNDDGLDGYSPGSHWVDTTGGTAWVCLSAATGAAVWQQLGASGITQLTGDVTAGPGSGSQVATIAAGVVVDSMVAAANKDGAAGTPSLRTLGTGAAQAAAGNDSRLTITALTESDIASMPPGPGGITNDDYFPFYDSSAAGVRKLSATRHYGHNWPSQVRLSATASADVTNTTSTTGIFLMPFGGGRFALWDGSRAVQHHIGILGVGLGLATLSGAMVSGSLYDVFLRTQDAVIDSVVEATDMIGLTTSPNWETGAQITVRQASTGIGGKTLYWRRNDASSGTLHATPSDAMANTAREDVFTPMNVGVTLSGLTLKLGAAWTDGSTRSAALGSIHNAHSGVHVLNSDNTWRLVGTIKATSTTTTADDEDHGYVASLYNDPGRPLYKRIGYNANNTGTTFTHGTTFGELSTGSKVEWVTCFGCNVAVSNRIFAVASASGLFRWGVGIDATSPLYYGANIASSTLVSQSGATATRLSTPGYHYAALYGLSDAGSATIQGDGLMPGLGTTDMSTTNISATVTRY